MDKEKITVLPAIICLIFCFLMLNWYFSPANIDYKEVYVFDDYAEPWNDYYLLDCYTIEGYHIPVGVRIEYLKNITYSDKITIEKALWDDESGPIWFLSPTYRDSKYSNPVIVKQWEGQND